MALVWCAASRRPWSPHARVLAYRTTVHAQVAKARAHSERVSWLPTARVFRVTILSRPIEPVTMSVGPPFVLLHRSLSLQDMAKPALRVAALALHARGRSRRQIASTLRVSISTVRRWVLALGPQQGPEGPRAARLRRRRALVLKVAKVIFKRGSWSRPKFPSCSAIAAEVRRRGTKVSKAGVHRDLHRLGLVSRVRPRVPSTNPADVRRRFAFACSWVPRLLPARRLPSIVFSDESHVLLWDSSSRLQWVTKGSDPSPREQYGWATRVVIFAAIGIGWRSKIVFVTHRRGKEGEVEGRMDSAMYIRKCLSPIVPHIVASKSLFMQDGARIHTAKKTLKYLASKGVSVLQDWPPRSPDLNGIELAWAYLKRKVSGRAPRDEEELKQFLTEEWNSIPVPIVDKWTEHFFNRVFVVHQKRGKYC